MSQPIAILALAAVLLCAGGARAADGPGTAPAVEPPPVLIALREADERRRAYQPQGVQAGPTLVNLKAVATLNHDDNIYAEASGGRSALITEAAAEADLRAGSEGHVLTAEGQVVGVHHAGHSAMDHVRGGLAAALALEGWDRSRLDLEGGWSRRHERPGDPDAPGAAARTVPLDLWRGEGDLLVRRGLWLIGIEAAARRLNYYDTDRLGGGDLEQDDRDRWETEMATRAGIAPTPLIDIYAAYEETLHAYDRPTPLLQLTRDSRAETLWLGLTLDRSERLGLEAAWGQTERSYASPFFPTVESPVWRGAATVALTPLTTLQGGAWQRLEETSATAYSTIIARGWQVGVDHELLRNLVLRGSWQTVRRIYEGPAPDRRDHRRRLSVGADWRLNDRWGLGGEVVEERTDSSFDVFDMRRRRLTLRLTAAL